ncbi:asparaginase [Paenibacillus doosanensis]|uniref:asparaginase n=1 Tax=Paenibacillus doosanensis TaxID=1229154 RepID=UPI00217F8169|nr:asparaginase [Paenibacillus doosanensis]MCS7459439.1 asparaginase [Paenibacillus doosanensis]
MMDSEIMVEAVRGALTESAHRGHLAVIDTERRCVASVGSPLHYTFARSAAKLLQAIPLLESGGAAQYAFDDRQIALICASHNGEDEHASCVLQTLRALGLDESALRCGVHEPYHRPTADRLKRDGVPLTPLRNNCSGKHAGMLALSLWLQAPAQTYTSADHPVQRLMLQTVSEMCGLPEAQITLAVDGCGVPVFAMPLAALAYAFARLGSPDSLPAQRAEACRRIVAAIAAQPYYVAGTGRFDTRLAEVTRGRVIGKMGAEGVYALTIPERGWGLALKIEDGSARALYPAVMEALIQLDALLDHEIASLSEFHRPAVINRHEREVGRLIPVFKLSPGIK